MSIWTFAFQVVNFLILALVLRHFLFRPVTAMIAKRQGEIERASKEAEAAKRAADETHARYDDELAKLRLERERLLEDVRVQIAREREAATGQARAEAARILEAAGAEIARQRADVAGRLVDQAVGLGANLAKRLLEQVADTGIAEILLQRACDHLESMPAERLRALRAELQSGAAPLEVATSPALEAAAVTRWGQRIARDLDSGTQVRFVADAALIAGAELRFPQTKISFCWRDGLAEARRELVSRADAG